MRLIIAEKPSVGKAIAGVLPGNQERVLDPSNGFPSHYIVGDTVVSWCVGHILELAPPQYYNPKYARWNAADLPYKIDKYVLLPKEKTKSQLETLGRLIAQADEIVNCGDPDREGQMLVDEVLEYYGWKGKTLRMHLNSTDDESVKKALKSMRDNQEFYWLYQSAICRSVSDWLIGMNLSVAATTLLSNDCTISIGRVQTPTLALLVKRDLDIEKFKAKEFFTLVATVTTTDKKVIELKHEPVDEARIYEKAVAQKIASGLKGKPVVLNVRETEKKEQPPKPFTLLSFSKEAEKRYGWSAKKCLDILQKLYEPEFGLTTYPRTSCEFLKDEQRELVPKIIAGLTSSSQFKEHAELCKNPVLRNSVFDSKKVEEHHAIIPTGRLPGNNITSADKKTGVKAGDYLLAWQLVAERFLMAILPEFIFKETVIWFEAENERDFSLRGIVAVNQSKSWRALDHKTNSQVPAIANGTSANVTDCIVKPGKTTPPKPYTEADLMTDMAAIAKFVSDPRIKNRLKETSGIGTAATRAAIIETLKHRNYAVIKGRNIISTKFGRSFITAMPDVLKDPGMTALWEDALDLIAKNEYSTEEYMERLHHFIANRIEEMRKAKGTIVITGQEKTIAQKKTASAQTARTSKQSAF